MATFRGTTGNDQWNIVEVGKYTIDGLAGTDTVAFGIQARSFFEITRGLDGAIHVDTVSGASGGGMQAVLYNIEVLVFNSGTDSVTVAELFPAAHLVGTAGDDRFTAGTGAQTIDGLAGIDQVDFSLARINYLLNKGATDWSVTATAGNASLTLKNIERLNFTDFRLALDLAGNAGIVAKILGAVFDSPSLSTLDYRTYAGIGLSLMDSGQYSDASGYGRLVQLALDARLGVGASHAAVVDLLFTNVVNRAPSAEERAGFVAMLDAGMKTHELGMLAAEHELNLAQIDFTGLQLNGLPFL